MSERQSLVLLLGLYLFFAFGYSILMPMWEAPDEAFHYTHALSVLKEGKSPLPEENYEATQPALYYWGSSVVLRILEIWKPSWVNYYAPPQRIFEPERAIYRWSPQNYRVMVGAQVLRWVSVFVGGVTVWCIYQAGKTFSGGDVRLALAGASLAGLTPQFLHVSSSVNNDVLGNFVGAGMFWVAGLVCSGMVSGRWLALTSFAGLFLPFITKLTVLPMGLTLFVASAWQGREFLVTQWRQYFWVAVGVFGVTILGLVILAPTMAKNLWAEIIYRGFTVRTNLGETLFFEVYWAFIQSYWGKVGWLTTGLEPYTSQMLTQFVFFGWVMTVRLFVSSTTEERFRWGIVWLTIILAFLIVSKNTLTTPQFQGRFFFPEIGAISLLCVAGWMGIIRKWAKPYFWIILLFVMAGLNLWFWLAKIIPVYFQPFLDWY